MKEEYKLVIDAWERASGGLLGPVRDADLDRHTEKPISNLQDYLESMEQEGLIERVRVGNPDGFIVLITAMGRIELGKLRLSQDQFRKKAVESIAIKVVPKGLRAFDEYDADFFLELLPGPRRANGLPDSIHFWKTRIEELDPEKTFKVGAIFGPSGCGKQSLIKAGLLPRLSKSVIPVYVEATAGETEARLLRGLRKHIPTLGGNLDLYECLNALSKGAGTSAKTKVLIVLNQFEQWLHPGRKEGGNELALSLRQCDGTHVQALLLIGDNAWTDLTRFMEDIGIPLRQWENFTAIDFFDLRHARSVLTRFGQAYGRYRIDSTTCRKINGIS